MAEQVDSELDLLWASFESAQREYQAVVTAVRITSTDEHKKRYVEATRVLREARRNLETARKAVRR